MIAPAAQVAVSGIGIVSPVGLTAESACAAIAAGVSRFSEQPWYECLPAGGEASDGEPEFLVASAVPGNEGLSGPDRLARLANGALQAIVSRGALSRAELRHVRLHVALPFEDETVRAWGLRGSFALDLARRSGLDGWEAAVEIPGGPAAAFEACGRAAQALGAGEVPLAVVLAADTFLDARRLARLDAAGRIRSTRNVDGFVPGEAGVALLLEPRRSVERRGALPFAVLGGFGAGTESAPLLGERSSTSRGLCAALAPLLEGAGYGRILCDLNGESYRAHEWGLAQVRLAGLLPPSPRLDHPADCVGDSGVALAAMLVAMACQGSSGAPGMAGSALLWVGSDGGARAAMAVRAPA